MYNQTSGKDASNHSAPDLSKSESARSQSREPDAEAMELHDHEYMHAHGIPHAHTHSHTHTHENTKAVLNRLSRAIGHLQSVRKMVEEGRDCSEVLVQIAAVRSAIDNTGKVILQDHLKHCIMEAAAEGDQKAIDDLCQAIEKYMK